MILKAIKKLLKPKIRKDEIAKLEAPVIECGSGYFTQGYGSFVGIPAPKVLKNDPWFGEPIMSEQQKEIFTEDIVVNMDGGVGGSWKVDNEPVNIHEVMYDMATKTNKTTTQLNPIGASENFQGGSENLYG